MPFTSLLCCTGCTWNHEFAACVLVVQPGKRNPLPGYATAEMQPQLMHAPPPLPGWGCKPGSVFLTDGTDCIDRFRG